MTDNKMQKKNNNVIPYAVIIGLVFGYVDWFFTAVMIRIIADTENVSQLLRLAARVANVGVWLLPILPIVYFAARQASSIWDSVKAGVTTWSYAILAYYLTYAVQISLGKVAGWEHLNIFSGKENEFWLRYWEVIRTVILIQIIEWIWVAIFGGALIGAGMFWLLKLKRKRPSGA